MQNEKPNCGTSVRDIGRSENLSVIKHYVYHSEVSVANSVSCLL